ncbi:MAG: glycosyltransferase family 2 protein [Planctomycetota bacterium]|nr:glycosyltransferase family 2 protein [Planctomycetota bacterium]
MNESSNTPSLRETSPDLSIVIPAYGGEDELEKCLAALAREEKEKRLSPNTEIVVADDATPGGLSKDLIERHKNRVNFVFGKENLGFAGNANRGVEASAGRVLCLLNTDMYVEPGYFVDCLQPFNDDPKLFAVTGQINEPTGNNDGYKTLFMDGVQVSMQTVNTSDALSSKRAPIPYANGGGSFFSRKIFMDLEGFDSIFTPYYWEDTDLGYRAWKRGFHIRYDPRHVLIHDHQGTIGKEKKKRVKRIFKRNRRFFIWRNNTSQGLFSLVWRSSIGPMLKAFLTLRLAKAMEFFGDLKSVPAIAATRKRGFTLDVRSDQELLELWSQSSEDRAKRQEKSNS